jgi:diguanylate cyclase (GGDEF)-like protein/PAS domain S-box-containing protein
MAARTHKAKRPGGARRRRLPARRAAFRRLPPAQDRALQALRESEERFREIFEQVAVGLTRVDLDGVLVDFNQKFCDMLGYTRAELLGKTIRDITHSADYGQGSGYRAELAKGAARSRSGEKRFVRKDGSVMWARRTMSAACDDAGNPRYVISVVEDISDGKLVEERYRSTFDSAPIGIMHTRIEDDRILHANPRACEMLGYSLEELLGLYTDDMLPPSEQGTDRGKYRDRMLSGEMKVYSSERRWRRKDGSIMWVNRTVSLAHDTAGQPLYFIRIIEDITERTLSRQRLAMEHAITQLLAESATVEEAMPRLLRVMCESMGWAYGARWTCDPEEGMRRADCWADFVPEFDPADASQWLRQGVRGSMVLLHRTWHEKQPTWIVSIERHGAFRRAASSRKFDLHSAFAFPVVAEGAVIGVMEFFSRETREPDEMLLKVAHSIGTQVGQFIQRKQGELALQKSEERYREVFEASPMPMWASDNESLAIVEVNQAAIEHYGYSRAEFLRMSVRELWDPAERAGYGANMEERMRNGNVRVLRRHRTRDGRPIDVEVNARRLIVDGRPVWLTLVNDITDRRRAEAALRESEEQFRQLANNIPQAFWITNLGLRETTYISPAAASLTGRPLDELYRNPKALITSVHEEDRRRVYEARKTALDGGYDQTYRVVKPDGTIRWVHDRGFPVRDASGRAHRIAGIAEDITDRKAAEERLMHLAHYDVLTNLPNRVLFYDRLGQTLAQAKRNQWIVGVLFIDIDRFKNVNDTLGHAVGDKLLQQVAERLKRSVRAGDAVGRLGGDEFAIMLSNLTSAQDASHVAQKIMASFDDPFKLEGADFYVTSSIGVTLYPDDSVEQEALIKNADAAMYRAKELGRNTFQFYKSEMNARALEVLSMESSLRRALDRDEFILHFQPKAGVAEGGIVGVEALLRWRHPERGLVSPADFMPVLEETGLIVPVGDWVLKAVCRQIKAWQRAGIRVVPVAVNLSPREFAAKDLRKTVMRVLGEHGVEPSLLELEITEGSLMVNTGEVVATLEALGQLGIGISIDDFGTGYSSLSYLKRFPLDALKIDRSFVKDITTDTDDATITRAVISMAHSLGLKVIAEGVETESQLAFLASHACDEIQGYYFARPLPADECGAWLRERRSLRLPRAGAENMAAVR